MVYVIMCIINVQGSQLVYSPAIYKDHDKAVARAEMEDKKLGNDNGHCSVQNVNGVL